MTAGNTGLGSTRPGHALKQLPRPDREAHMWAQCRAGHEGWHRRLQVERFGFLWWVYDWLAHSNDDLSLHPEYCPAQDVISREIAVAGMWEPATTQLITDLLRAHNDPTQGVVIDYGAHIGWFTTIAAAAGYHVYGIDVNAENVAVLRRNAAANMLGWRVHPVVGWVDEHAPPFDTTFGHVTLAKIDIEGAEEHAVQQLWPLIEVGSVDHLIIEISPVFHDRYPDLVDRIVDAGYTGRVIVNPGEVRNLPKAAAARRNVIESWHQENVWFDRRGS